MQSRNIVALCLLLVCLAACGYATSPSTNSQQTRYPIIQVSQGIYTGYASPFLAVNPHDPRNLLGAAWYRQTRALTGHIGLVRIGTFFSFDEGKTWHENSLLPVPAGYTESIDETVAFMASGIGFVAAVLRQNQHDASSSAIAIWRTDDGGQHFTSPLLVDKGNYLANVWITVNSVDAKHSGLIVLAWKHANAVEFSRSLDHGRSFTHPITISRTSDLEPNWPIILIGPTGNMYVIYVAYDSIFAGSTINEVTSSDLGVHFQPSHLVIKLSGMPERTPRLPSTESAAIDPHTGTLYIAFALPDQMPGHTDIELISSQNGGQSWSAPGQVNNDLLGDPVARYQPQVAIQSDGTVDVFYMALTSTGMSSFLARSTTHGMTFASALPLTNIHTLKSGEGSLVGERQGLAIGTQRVYPFWSDVRHSIPVVLTTSIPY